MHVNSSAISVNFLFCKCVLLCVLHLQTLEGGGGGYSLAVSTSPTLHSWKWSGETSITHLYILQIYCSPIRLQYSMSSPSEGVATGRGGGCRVSE